MTDPEQVAEQIVSDWIVRNAIDSPFQVDMKHAISLALTEREKEVRTEIKKKLCKQCKKEI